MVALSGFVAGASQPSAHPPRRVAVIWQAGTDVALADLHALGRARRYGASGSDIGSHGRIRGTGIWPTPRRCALVTSRIERALMVVCPSGIRHGSRLALGVSAAKGDRGRTCGPDRTVNRV
jgi:hypothetical protein